MKFRIIQRKYNHIILKLSKNIIPLIVVVVVGCSKTEVLEQPSYLNIIKDSIHFNYPIGAKCWLEWPTNCVDFIVDNYDMDFSLGDLAGVSEGRLFNFFAKHIMEQLRNENFKDIFSEEELSFFP